MPARSVIRAGRRNVEISNADKLMFPEDGITKGDLIDYYLRVSDAMLPEVRDRLITLERFPNGLDDKRFWQKEASSYFPRWVPRQTVPKKGGTVSHAVVDSKAVLVYFANQAAITLHMSLARTDALDRPDQMIFDLDPSTDDFGLVVRTAIELRELLSELKLFSVVKTSGSKGLHVTVPLDGSASFEETGRFARTVAQHMAGSHPDRLTIEQRKDDRGDRLFLDWMRNSRTATVVAPFTVRARPGAPVAMPVDWDDLRKKSFSSQRYRMKEAIRLVEEGWSPWKGWRRRARSLDEPGKRLARLGPLDPD